MLFDEPDHAVENWRPPAEFPILPAGFVALDLETKDEGLSQGVGPGWPWGGGKIVGIALTWATGECYIPVQHPGGGNLDLRLVLRWLKDQMRRKDITWVLANALYDFGWIGEWPEGRVIDVQILAPLLNENKRAYGLDALGKEYLGVGKKETSLERYAAMRGWKRPKDMIWRMPAPIVAPYALQDTRLTLDLALKMLPICEQEELGQAIALEEQLQPILWMMRRNGVRVDLDGAERLKLKYEQKTKEAIQQIQRQTGVTISPWDVPSLAKALAHEGINVPQTATGLPSVTKELLAEWGKAGSVSAKLILSARQYDKAKSTFIEGHFLGSARNGRIFPEFPPLRSETDDGSGYGTVSYRFSCRNPNLQQLPGRGDEFTADIRGLCLPEEGEEWHSADYSQQEPRMAIHYAEGMKVPGGKEAADRLRATSDTWDFHTETSEIVGIPRKRVKSISLGRMYGAGDAGCATLMGLPTVEIQTRNGPRLIAGPEAKVLLDTYDAKYPWVRESTDYVKDVATRRGWIRLLGGYRARFARRKGEVGDFPHKAFNRLVQGGSAAQTKKSIIIYYEITGRVPLVTVHDENGVSGGNREKKALAEAMVSSFAEDLRVPMRVDATSGRSWGEAALAED
jgi:DNA polymerase I-like protein with 3'-5' exonuclease and polymerase domains